MQTDVSVKNPIRGRASAPNVKCPSAVFTVASPPVRCQAPDMARPGRRAWKLRGRSLFFHTCPVPGTGHGFVGRGSQLDVLVAFADDAGGALRFDEAGELGAARPAP